ncbi:MAG: hypothetical protein LZ173_02145 [Thaumarchaeota archaeon]|jgi:hypothetical protein|nr:hypothetical protein [Candidatus Geocrenenecus arthurdayi]
MSEGVNLVKSLAKTIDDFLDNIGLGRPLEKVIEFFEATAPSKLAKKAGLPPAPGEVVDSSVGSAIKGVEESKVPPVFEEVKRKVKEVVS